MRSEKSESDYRDTEATKDTELYGRYSQGSFLEETLAEDLSNALVCVLGVL